MLNKLYNMLHKLWRRTKRNKKLLSKLEKKAKKNPDVWEDDVGMMARV